MAKKTFNIKRTLDVQPKQFSVDDIESAVKQIHDAKTVAVVNPPVAKEDAPKKAEKAPKTVEAPAKQSQISPPSPVKRNREAEEAPVRKVRLSVDIHPATHKKLKIKAIEQDSDIMHYVEMLIERDLGLA
ncbi:MAG: hypothetical protein IPN76_24845 [Saprospiraceae bacterium]|nr:hypothetical protein [Saprospiraceae bacterium]